MEIKKMKLIGQATNLSLGKKLLAFLSSPVSFKNLSYTTFRKKLETIYSVFTTLNNEGLNMLLSQLSGYAVTWNIEDKGKTFNILKVTG